MAIFDPKSNFIDFLRSANLRVTPERLEILALISETDAHFDAEALYARLKGNRSKISRATVYNTLELLRDCGLVTRLRFSDNLTRYEKAFDQRKHEHLICMKCGGVTEFTSDKLVEIQAEACGQNQFLPKSSVFQVFGLCINCQTAKLSTNYDNNYTQQSLPR